MVRNILTVILLLFFALLSFQILKGINEISNKRLLLKRALNESISKINFVETLFSFPSTDLTSKVDNIKIYNGKNNEKIILFEIYGKEFIIVEE